MKKILFILLLLPLFASAQNDGKWKESKDFKSMRGLKLTDLDFSSFDTTAFKPSFTDATTGEVYKGYWGWLGGSGGSGITTLNTLTGATQTFATGTSGTDFGISSSSTTHTFNIPDASATARGMVTTGAQVFAGNKQFDGSLVIITNSFNPKGVVTLGSLTATTQSFAQYQNNGVYEITGSHNGTPRIGIGWNTNDFYFIDRAASNAIRGRLYSNGVWTFGVDTTNTPLITRPVASGVGLDVHTTGFVGVGKKLATERLDVSGNVRFSGALMPSNAAGTSGQVLTSAGAGSPPTWGTILDNNTWFPTITAGVNVSSSSDEFGHYTRIGNQVAFTLYVRITPTAGSAACIFDFSLPIASNLAFQMDAICAGSCIFAGTNEVAQGYANTVDDRITVSTGLVSSTSVRDIIITGHYTIL